MVSAEVILPWPVVSRSNSPPHIRSPSNELELAGSGRCPGRPRLEAALRGCHGRWRLPRRRWWPPVRRHRGAPSRGSVKCSGAVRAVPRPSCLCMPRVGQADHGGADGGRTPRAIRVGRADGHRRGTPFVGQCRPRLRPRRTACECGYSNPPARRRLRQRRVEPVSLTRKDQPSQPDFCKAVYRERNDIEPLIGRRKQHRHIATR